MRGREEHEFIANQRTEELIANYPSYLQDFYVFMDNKSYTTKRKYIIYILHMLKSIKGTDYVEIEDVAKILPSDLRTYMSSLKYRIMKDGRKEIVSNGIRAVRWSALSGFYKFLVKAGYLYFDPFTDYVERPTPKEINIKNYLTKKEIRELIKCIEEKADYYYRSRDLAIVMLVLTTGIKESVVSEINISDIDSLNNRILVHEKSGDRYIYPAEVTFVYIKEWLVWREILQIKNKSISIDALFVNRYYKRVTPHVLMYMLNSYVDIFDRKITFEMLRSSCVVYLYEETKDAFLTIKAMGLKSLRELERYIVVEEDNEKQAGIVMDKFLERILEVDTLSADENFELGEEEVELDFVDDVDAELNDMVECDLSEEFLECDDFLEEYS